MSSTAEDEDAEAGLPAERDRARIFDTAARRAVVGFDAAGETHARAVDRAAIRDAARDRGVLVDDDSVDEFFRAAAGRRDRPAIADSACNGAVSN